MLLVFEIAFSTPVFSQDYEREKRWADQIQASLMIGDAVWLQQKNGHKFLSLYTEAKNPKGAVIIAHGRGWSPDYEIYGVLRMRLADMGWTTMAIQLPVLPSTAIMGLYIPLYPDARERFQLAVDYLKGKGFKKIAIVSHSLGATMANQYLIRTDDHSVGAWVYVSIIQGLEEMYRIHIPTLDVYGEKDWDVTRWGGPERLAQLKQHPGSRQVVIPQAGHFYEGREEALLREINGFLEATLVPEAKSGKQGK